jgi:hypothetical protein
VLANVSLNQTHAVEMFLAPDVLMYLSENVWLDPPPYHGFMESAVTDPPTHVIR